MLRDDEEFQSLESSSSSFDDARERIGLEERVAVVGHVKHTRRRVRLRNSQIERMANNRERQGRLALAPLARLVLDVSTAGRATVGHQAVGDDATLP